MLVENEPGVTARIAGLFAGRGYNIETICGAPTANPRMSRITITTKANPQRISDGGQDLAVSPAFINRIEQPESTEAWNPIQELLDRIEELKKEMSLFHEKMSPMSSQNRNSYKRSSRYTGFDPDPSQLLFGERQNRRGGQRRYF